MKAGNLREPGLHDKAKFVPLIPKRLFILCKMARRVSQKAPLAYGVPTQGKGQNRVSRIAHQIVPNRAPR